MVFGKMKKQPKVIGGSTLLRARAVDSLN